MKGAPKVEEMLAAITNEEKRVTDENARLQKVLQIQNALIEKERNILVDVAKTSQELYEIEKKRAELKSKLSSHKTQLLVAASEAQEAMSVIQTTLADGPDSPAISETQSGKFALKIVEAINQNIFQLTEACLKSDSLSVDAGKLHEAINDVNSLIQKVIDADLATETQDDTIRRNSFVISNLVNSQPQE